MRIKAHVIEIFLIQLVIYLAIWIWNDYFATLISFIFGGIGLSVLLVSLLVELVEKSRISSWYYQFMFSCISAPAIAFVIYLSINKGLDWVIS